MASSLASLIESGTRLWLDSVDPDEIAKNRALGATGATSNPIIIADLVKTGRFDDLLGRLFDQGMDDEAVAWAMTDHLVSHAQEVFHEVWQQTRGNDGYVSFELDPLLEDAELAPPVKERTAKYIELGQQWSADQDNRMIKVPATEAGLAALEDLAAAGVTINVTLIFSPRQYEAARAAIWRGRQRYGKLDAFKSVYSIFISRVDVWASKKLDLSKEAAGQVGLLNVKRLWHDNQRFWSDKNLKLDQEIIFASTGAKLDWQPADYYVEALAGSDIQTNPPATNAEIEAMGKTYTRQVDQMPDQQVIDEIDAKLDMDQMERDLMDEGTAKFADPHKKLLNLIADKRKSLAAAS